MKKIILWVVNEMVYNIRYIFAMIILLFAYKGE